MLFYFLLLHSKSIVFVIILSLQCTDR